MSENYKVIIQLLVLSSLAGCAMPVAIAPGGQGDSVTTRRTVEAPSNPVTAADHPGLGGPTIGVPARTETRNQAMNGAVTITGRLWDDAPGQVSHSSGYAAYAPAGAFNADRSTERLGVVPALDPFEFTVPSTSNDRSLVVFHNSAGIEGDLYLKSFYVSHDRPTVDLGDVVMGYRIDQTMDGEPGTLRLTFPGGHGETKRTVEVVAMRTIDETGLFIPPMSERMNSYYQDKAWHTPIEPKTVAVVETGDEPSVTVKGLDNHRWYAVRVKMDLPDGGQAVTSVNSFLAGRDKSMRISSEWAKCPTCIDTEQRQLSPEEVAALNEKVAEGSQ